MLVEIISRKKLYSKLEGNEENACYGQKLLQFYMKWKNKHKTLSHRSQRCHPSYWKL